MSKTPTMDLREKKVAGDEQVERSPTTSDSGRSEFRKQSAEFEPDWQSTPASSVTRWVASGPLAAATEKQKPSPWTKNMFQLYGVASIAAFSCVANAYVTTYIGQIGSNSDQFNAYFGIASDPLKPSAGALTTLYSVGSISCFFLVGPACDYKGRKWGIFAGALMWVIWGIVAATSHSLAQLLVSRFMQGAGNALIVGGAAPIYIAEIAHPSYRGAFSGLYNACWTVGALPAIAAAHDIGGNWRLPMWVELAFAGFIMVGALFLPESPRWLMANGREEEALNFMAKYHGDGDRESALVQLEYMEMKEAIPKTGSDKRIWDFSEFFATKDLRYRMMLVIAMPIIAQFSGITGQAYYYGTALSGAGLTSEYKAYVISNALSVVTFLFAIFGSIYTDTWGRRRAILISFTAFIILFAVIQPLTATTIEISEGEPVANNKHRAGALAAMVNIWGVTYSTFITPIVILYSIECLPYETRAKGLALTSLTNAITLFYNQFVTSIAFDGIMWKYYFVYMFFDIAAVVFVYFFFVETSNRTLEEIAVIFKADKPVKTSLTKSKVVISGDEIIVCDIDID